MTVTFPKVYTGKPLDELAGTVREVVTKEFKQIPIRSCWPSHWTSSDSVELRLAILQAPRRRGRLRLELRYPDVVFGSEIQQSFLREGVGVLGKPAAAFCLFF